MGFLCQTQNLILDQINPSTKLSGNCKRERERERKNNFKRWNENMPPESQVRARSGLTCGIRRLCSCRLEGWQSATTPPALLSSSILDRRRTARPNSTAAKQGVTGNDPWHWQEGRERGFVAWLSYHCWWSEMMTFRVKTLMQWSGSALCELS